MIVIPVVLLVVALVVAVVAGLAWSANLPGNGYVGIRAPEARKSKENWDITHRVAGPPWAVAALAFAGSAALAFIADEPNTSGWLWLWVVVAAVLGLAMLGVGGAIGSHTIALYDAKKTAESESAGCGSDCGCGSAEAGASATEATAPGDPSADCGVAGGCGACGLNGMCEGGDATFGSASGDTGNDPTEDAPKASAVDRDALRRAARATRAGGTE